MTATESLDAFDLDAVSVEPLPPPAPSPTFEALDESIAMPASRRLPWIAGGLALVAIVVVAAFWMGGDDTPPIVAANAARGVTEPSAASAGEANAPPAQPIQPAQPVQPMPTQGTASEPTPSSTTPTDAPAAEEPAQPEPSGTLQAEPSEPATEPASDAMDESEPREEPAEPDEDEEPEQAGGSSTDRVRELISTGNFFRGRAQWDRARRAYETALRSSPRNGPALAGLAKVALAQRRASEAVRLARTLVQVNARTAGNHVLLGDALSASGDRAGARQAWEQALRINPRHPTARARLGR